MAWCGGCGGGFAVDPETLAYDVIARVGPGGNYLMEESTVLRCRTEFWKPGACDRGGLEAWMATRQDAVARARVRWQKLVRDQQGPELDQVIGRQLGAYVESHIAGG